MKYAETPSNAEEDFEETRLALGKDEMNLAEFPFAMLSKHVSPDQKTFQVVQEGRDSHGHVIRQEWLVTGSERFGLPVASDDEVYVALMKLLRDHRFAGRTVQFTVAQLLRIMQSGTSKRDYERVGQAFDRLTGVLIRSTNAFWDHARQRYVTEGFHLLDSYRLSKGGAGRELSEATFSEFLFNSMQAGYVKNLDIDFYFRLSTPLARRYYRLLDKHRYRSRTYEVEIHRLAQRLPLQDVYVSQLRRRLDPVHAELTERGFLEGVEYRSGASGETILRIRFATDRVAATQTPSVAAVPVAEEPPATTSVLGSASLEERLRLAGISRKVAAELVQGFPGAEIERQLDYLPHVQGLKNPGGYLRLAIEHGYGPPPGWGQAQRKPDRPRRVQAAASAPAIDPVDQAWETLTEHERTQLQIRAETDLRATQTIWQGSRRIPAPFVTAHARHLLTLDQSQAPTMEHNSVREKLVTPKEKRIAPRSDAAPRHGQDETEEEERAAVKATLANAPFLRDRDSD